MSYGTAEQALSVPRAQDQSLILGGKGVMFISDPWKIETMRRADRATGRTVAGVEGGAHLVGMPRPRTHALECADNAADLIVQKRPRAQVKMNLGACRPWLL